MQDSVEIQVRDPGEGIPPQMVGQVFEPFVQVKQGSDRARGGLGLGLAIARNIVTLHGGSIRAHSEGPGRGAELTVRLPIAPKQPALEPVSSRREPERQRTARRVLLVDDNVDGADVLASVLEAHGHRVLTAYDAAEALRVAADFRPDVALLDVGLPVMDGYELARSLKEVTAAAAPKFVALTGYGLPADRERSSAAGFYAHLVKPVDVEQLLELVERASLAPGSRGV